jgi:hypothetical protein
MIDTNVHAAWARLGAGVSVAPLARRVDVEDLIVRTLSMARGDARLFWVAASWVSVHHSLLNTRRLVARLKGVDGEERAVAGALFGVARSAAGAVSMLDSVLKHCAPITPPQPLFANVGRNAVLTAKVREGALPLFSRWGFWQDDVSLRADAVRPVRWVLAHCPEFRSRAILGATLEAEIVDVLVVVPGTAQDVSRICGTTYSAAFEAIARLVGRGWVTKRRQGARQVLALAEDVARWYNQFPLPLHAGAVDVADASPSEAAV